MLCETHLALVANFIAVGLLGDSLVTYILVLVLVGVRCFIQLSGVIAAVWGVRVHSALPLTWS